MALPHAVSSRPSTPRACRHAPAPRPTASTAAGPGAGGPAGRPRADLRPPPGRPARRSRPPGTTLHGRERLRHQLALPVDPHRGRGARFRAGVHLRLAGMYRAVRRCPAHDGPDVTANEGRCRRPARRVLGEDGGDQVALGPLPVQPVVHRGPGRQSREHTSAERDQPCREHDPGVDDVTAAPWGSPARAKPRVEEDCGASATSAPCHIGSLPWPTPPSRALTGPSLCSQCPPVDAPDDRTREVGGAGVASLSQPLHEFGLSFAWCKIGWRFVARPPLWVVVDRCCTHSGGMWV